MNKYAFGVDIGGTTVKMGFFDERGHVLDKWEIPKVRDNGGESILPDTAESLLAKMAEKGIREEELAGVSARVPAAVDSEDTLMGEAVNHMHMDLAEVQNLHWRS